MNEKKYFAVSIIFLLCCVFVSLLSLFETARFVNYYNRIVFPVCEDERETKEEIVLQTETELIEEPKEKQNIVNFGEFRLTAYCSCERCCGYWATVRPVDENGNEVVYGSSGSVLIPGVSVAVDTDVIPYGSKLIIDGKTYIAQDTGSGIKGNCIDVYHEDHQKAVEFGVQYKEIFLIGG